MSKLSPSHRVGLTEDEILSVLEDLQELRSTVGISTISLSAYNKISTVYHKISLGSKVPDYVPNGRKRESKINMDSLGVPQEERARYNNPAELSADASQDARNYELQLKLKDYAERTCNVTALSFSAAEIRILRTTGKLPDSLNVEAVRTALEKAIVGLPTSLVAMLTESAEKTIEAFTAQLEQWEDRRQEPRTEQEDSHPTDNDNVFAAFSATHRTQG